MNIPFLKKQKSAESQPAEGVTPTAQFAAGITTIQDILAPDAIEVDFSHIKIGNKYVRTLFVAGYPRFVTANWLSPLINFDHSLDIAMYIYPIEGKGVLEDLRRKITEMEAEINSDIQRGRIANIDTQVKLEDAKALQEQLAKGAERFYQFGLYVTLTADNEEELNHLAKQVQSTLGALLIIAKPASLVMEEAFKTTQPFGQDLLNITRNMDTTSLATTFPFTSSELTANEGILYGINEHNDSLVIFDRFSMENANMCLFAKSGSGKSYMVKLEALRSLMFDTEVIAIDPEDEYRRLCEAVRGQYIEFSFSSKSKINPFDLPHLKYGGPASTTGGENELSQKLLSLHSLMKIMLGAMDPTQEALLDRALVASYKAKGITPSSESQNNEPPLLEDLYKALVGMEDPQAANLAARLEKYVKGSFRGLFDQRTNVDLSNEFMVFGIKNLEDELRPVAMFMILDFIWTRVKSELRRRLLIVDEAWYLMKHQDSAMFLYSIAKRARKYYLGLTTITQDVEDFLHGDYGKAIVTNSSIQVLLKQSAAAIDIIQEVFYLSDGEKQLLLAAEIGEGLFFAGQNHVAMKVIASDDEHKLITSKPQELIEMSKTSSTVPTSASPVGAIPRRVDVGHGSGESLTGASEDEHKLITSKPQEILEMQKAPDIGYRISDIGKSETQAPTIRQSEIRPPTSESGNVPNAPLSTTPASPVPTPTPIPHNQKPITHVKPTVEYTSIFENPPKKSSE